MLQIYLKPWEYCHFGEPKILDAQRRSSAIGLTIDSTRYWTQEWWTKRWNRCAALAISRNESIEHVSFIPWKAGSFTQPSHGLRNVISHGRFAGLQGDLQARRCQCPSDYAVQSRSLGKETSVTRTPSTLTILADLHFLNLNDQSKHVVSVLFAILSKISSSQFNRKAKKFKNYRKGYFRFEGMNHHEERYSEGKGSFDR